MKRITKPGTGEKFPAHLRNVFLGLLSNFTDKTCILGIQCWKMKMRFSFIISHFLSEKIITTVLKICSLHN